MGILEFHFHESEFSFAPSVNGGDEGDDHDESAGDTTMDDSSTAKPVAPKPRATDGGKSGSVAKKGLGVLVGLAFLAGVGIAVKRLASKALGDDGDRLDTETVEESIEIAD